MKQLLFAIGISVLMAQTKPVPLSSFDARARELLARMTLDEKIGQMTQADQMFLKDPADIETYFLGSILSGGDSDPKDGNSREAWTRLATGIEGHADKTRLRIPLLYGVDAVHGHSNVLGAVIFPHNIGLGATRNARLVEQIGRITAEEVRATGIQWVFAPCVTVPQDIRWGRTGMKDSLKILRWLPNWAPLLCAGCRATVFPTRMACWRARSITSAMEAPRSERAGRGRSFSIRATCAWMKRHCGASICKAI